MGETKSTIIPLIGKNYPTWKIQCRMALMKDGLWGIVKGTEKTPGEDNAEAQKKYMARRDRALALVILAVKPSLLYLLGDPKTPQLCGRNWKSSFRGRPGRTSCSYEESCLPSSSRKENQ